MKSRQVLRLDTRRKPSLHNLLKFCTTSKKVSEEKIKVTSIESKFRLYAILAEVPDDARESSILRA